MERKVRICYNKGMKKQLDSIQCSEKDISICDWCYVRDFAIERELEKIYRSIIFKSNEKEETNNC